MSDQPSIQRLKEQAALKAVEYVKSGMVIGLGTGSTAIFATSEIGRRIKMGELESVICIPSSNLTAYHAKNLGIPLTMLDQHPNIDITIDGADEVDPDLNLIKGGGGALLREKIVAQASKQLIIIVDQRKIVPHLCDHFALPIEVIPFALKPVEIFLDNLGANKVILRKQENGETFKTDEGNVILDCIFDPISSPQILAAKLNEKAGIVEHGLFLNMASEVIVSSESGIQHLRKKHPE